MRSSSDGECGAEPSLEEEADGGRGGEAGAAGAGGSARGCAGAARNICTANFGSGRLMGSGGRSRGGRRGSVGGASGSSRRGVPAREAREPREPEPSRRRRWRLLDTWLRDPDLDRLDPPPALLCRS